MLKSPPITIFSVHFRSSKFRERGIQRNDGNRRPCFIQQNDLQIKSEVLKRNRQK